MVFTAVRQLAVLFLTTKQTNDTKNNPRNSRFLGLKRRVAENAEKNMHAGPPRSALKKLRQPAMTEIEIIQRQAAKT
ncbi:MAG: hypothetical protein WD045_06590, partial [Pirellulaceae bacterium]